MSQQGDIMNKMMINEKITKFTWGNPIQTDAVVLPVGGEATVEYPLEISTTSDGDIMHSFSLERGVAIYGLGEMMRGINKRGGVYVAFCADDPQHTPDKRSLYGAHNFFVVDGEVKRGYFFDYPGKMTFDFGFTNQTEMTITREKIDADCYVIEGDSILSIVKSFRELVGQSYVPPKWAFGYQQCRWSYPDHTSVTEIADRFEKADLPVDTIYLDIDYMERYKDFTIDEERFPNFKDYVAGMKERGLRLIPIIDAGVKIEDGYDVYEEGVEKGYFCTNEKGEPFTAAVWPGMCHFPDFLNAEARQWFGEKYSRLTDMGIEGFWNDMNEPALFYSKEGLETAIEAAKDAEGKNLDINSFFGLKDHFTSLQNKMDDYKSFYHNIDGKKVNHYDVHNLYGYNMTRAAAEGFETIDDTKRFLMFSRASYTGMHRYSGIWMGDNHSWWEHILLNIRMLPSLNMCGFMYVGADTGGFSSDADGELVTRWSQLSAFTPLFRNHAVAGSRVQEPDMFGDFTLNNIRQVLQFRYAMIPYLYSEFLKASENNEMMFRPIAFDYTMKGLPYIEDQLLLGDSLMIAPVHQANATGRFVILPEDMAYWKVSDYRDVELVHAPAGHHYLPLEINEWPLFIRKNKLMVMGAHANRVEDLQRDRLKVVGFVDREATYSLVDDDGLSKDLQATRERLDIKVIYSRGDITVDLDQEGFDELKVLDVHVLTKDGNIIEKSFNL